VRLTEKEYEQLMAQRIVTQRHPQLRPIASPAHVQENPVQAKSGKQTKTEMEYGRMLSMEFPGCPVVPWGLILRMANGHKYTPDYLVMLPDKYLLVEVKQRGKNGFRQNSYQRAKLAFDQCREEFKLFQFRWAEKHNREWMEKTF